MRRTAGYLFVVGVLLLYTVFSNMTQNTLAEECTVSDDIKIDVESMEEEETGEFQYSEELETYVQNIVNNTDPTLILADPQMDELKESLYEMKQAYPDKSYDELCEMLDTVETETEYLEMIGEYELIEDDASINIDASINASSITATSTGATLSDPEWRNTCNYICSDSWGREKALGDVIYSVSHSYFLPGLKVTNVAGSDCKKMIPQGICKVGGYTLISACCDSEEHNSVIYVLDGSMKYQCTLMTDIIAHVGGIAYDGVKYLWVCNSKNKTMRPYDMTNLQTMINTAKSRADTTYCIHSFVERPVAVTPSFCTYYDGMLWVGEFSETEKKYVIAYAVDGTKLTRGARIEVPLKSQGICFYKSLNTVYCAFTTSFKRIYDSTLYSYEIDYDDPTYILATLNRSNEKTISMPSMMEGICGTGGCVYAIFESAANIYRNGLIKSSYPCDRICSFPARYIYK